MKIFWFKRKQAKPEPLLVGRVLDIDLPELDIYGVEAKVDTGAFSGALHATNIREHQQPDGTTVLRFKPLNCKKMKQADVYTIRKVKSSNGAMSERYTINTTVQINGQNYPLRITLANRSGMRRQVLIGRKFLR